MPNEIKLIVRSSPSDNANLPFRNRKVLIIDDEASYRFALRRLIERKLGCTVYEADNPLQGLEIVQFRKPHLILLDMQMPYMDGKTALEELRKLEVGKSISVIAVTAVADRSLAVELRELGLAGYIIKPFDRDHVLQKIADELQKMNS